MFPALRRASTAMAHALATLLFALSFHGVNAWAGDSTEFDATFLCEIILSEPAAAIAPGSEGLVATYQGMLELLERELASVRGTFTLAQEERELASMEREDALREVSRLNESNASLAHALGEASAAQGRQSRPSIPAVVPRSTLIFDHLPMLPDSVPEVLLAMEAFFPDRLYFTERAHRSARQAAFDNPVQTWRAFVAMARDLYDIYFGANSDGSINVEEAFRLRSGLELALGESAATRDNARLMRLREDEYEGKTILAEAHVKLGRPPKAFRIHYYVDRARRRIVITHAGDHLETAGTSRM